MTTALAIVPSSIEGYDSLAERFAKSKLLPDGIAGKPADILVTLMAGQELGLTPMASIRGIHVIKGKPVLSADLMVAVVLGSGKASYFRRISEADDSVTYETHRIGSPEPQRCTWTAAQAKRAGLVGDNWRLYPRAMLAARAKSELARDVYPDVLAGCYDPDEARAFSGEPAPFTPRRDERDVVDVDAEPVADDFEQRIAACSTLAELQAVAEVVKSAPAGQRDALRAAYRAKREALTPAEVAA